MLLMYGISHSLLLRFGDSKITCGMGLNLLVPPNFNATMTTSIGYIFNNNNGLLTILKYFDDTLAFSARMNKNERPFMLSRNISII